MYFDKARDGSKNRVVIDEFGGLNRNLRINNNEFHNICNMSSKDYPVLSSTGTFANTLRTIGQYTVIRGMCALGDDIWIYMNISVAAPRPTVTTLRWMETGVQGIGIPYNYGGDRDEDRQMVKLGAYIVIFPDKYYINTNDITDRGFLEKEFDNVEPADKYNRWYVVKPCDADGKEYIADTYSATEPQSVSDGHVWYDFGEKVIKIWSSAYSMWITPTIYHKYRINGIGIFKEGSSVTFTCYRNFEEQTFETKIIKAYDGNSVDPDDADFVPMDADYIVIPASDDIKIEWDNWESRGVLFNKWRTLIRVSQKTPDMDYVCECNGRLWGCRYGETQTEHLREYRERYGTTRPTSSVINIESNEETVGEVLSYWLYTNEWVRINLTDYNMTLTPVTAQDGKSITVTINWGTYPSNETANLNVNYTVKKNKKLNEIYASKQQDFTSWNYYQGTALDSYTMSVGASGNWTGCVNYNGHPLFSKKDRLYLIYGDYPAQYSSSEMVCEGVRDGANKSMAVYNGVLYYLGAHGVYAYSGGYPQRISSALYDWNTWNTATLVSKYDSDNYLAVKATVGAVYKGCYYLHTNVLTDGTYFYVYDIKRGIWHRLSTKDKPVAFMDVLPTDDGCGLKAISFEKEDYDGDNPQTIFLSKIVTVETRDVPQTYDNWYFNTGLIGLDTPDQKQISRITIRYQGDADIFIKYDSHAPTEKIQSVESRETSLHDDRVGSHTFTFIPKRCDHFDLAFTGSGEFHLYSIAMTIDTGSEIDNE